ncbi:hypothetical protein SAMN05192574_104602 [Mucilaginibacter gossypiicola]|uniref:Uncharacterized protein n=1 Tax=Mucilaginibacter gossypiicola TaxID=551995 RepID=A0A1H8KGZ3_9SPHI|nr:hypothetical protein SAMN05192574_104602 [Mucilaginibacter gossypiicola]
MFKAFSFSFYEKVVLIINQHIPLFWWHFFVSACFPVLNFSPKTSKTTKNYQKTKEVNCFLKYLFFILESFIC